MDINSKVKALVRDEVQALQAYAVPDAAGLIKLDAMENPYPWPAAMRLPWQRYLQQVALNRYPDPQASTLKLHLRQAMQVPEGMDILLGNGSDEIIQIILMSLAKPGAVVLAPEPGFVMYRMSATATGMSYVAVPLNSSDFSLDLAAMLAAIEQHQPAVIFLAYPNNPTGNLFDARAIGKILRASNGLVVLDEAYHAFAKHSFMPQLTEYDNLVVMRTLSKLGLAGLRLGLLAGDPAWLQQFEKLRLPYNINSLTQACAEFILTQGDFLAQQAERICTQRESLMRELQALPGVQAWPSAANFILFRIQQGTAEQVYAGLLGEGVLIKNLHPSGGPLSQCLRVTVGTAEQNAAFLQALKNSLA